MTVKNVVSLVPEQFPPWQLHLSSDGDQRGVEHYGDTWSLGTSPQTVWPEPTESVGCRSMFRFYWFVATTSSTGSFLPLFLWCGTRIFVRVDVSVNGTGPPSLYLTHTCWWQWTNWISTLSCYNWWLGWKHSIDMLFIKFASSFNWVDMSALVWLILSINISACHFMAALMLRKQHTHTHASKCTENVPRFQPTFLLSFKWSVYFSILLQASVSHYLSVEQ